MLPKFPPVLWLSTLFPPPTPTPAVFNPTKEATPLDKGSLQLDFTSEVTENTNARSDHRGGEAAHRQTPNGRANNDPLDDKLRKILFGPSPCHLIQLMSPTSPSVLRLPAPFPFPPPTGSCAKPSTTTAIHAATTEAEKRSTGKRRRNEPTIIYWVMDLGKCFFYHFHNHLPCIPVL